MLMNQWYRHVHQEIGDHKAGALWQKIRDLKMTWIEEHGEY
jgi:hypothetical protein